MRACCWVGRSCRELPRSSTSAPSSQPPIEALLWLLLADELPSAQQLDALTAELAARAALPCDVEALVRTAWANYAKQVEGLAK